MYWSSVSNNNFALYYGIGPQYLRIMTAQKKSVKKSVGYD